MSNDRIYPPGVVPAAAVVLALVLVVGIACGALLGTCGRPDPVQMIPTPLLAAQATAIATSSAAVVATQSVRVTVRRRRSATSSAVQSGPSPAVTLPVASTSADQDDEEIIIDVSQGITAEATSTTTTAASASADQFRDATQMVPYHGRLGVLLGTFPGLVALDVELARIDVPPWILGTPLELGLDVGAGPGAAVAGVSVGGKAYLAGGAWSRWTLTEQGIWAGTGLRF